MGSTIEAVESLATKLGVRPLAARGYWLWQNAIRTLGYNSHRLRSDTYRVTIGEARADMSVLTKQEYNDFVHLPEQPILEEMLSELRPSDVFYDIGANVGLYSCLAADVIGPKVVAFEPHPKNADRLARNAAINEFEIAVHRIALADSSGSTQMKLSPGFDIDKPGSAGHTLLTEYYDEESDTVTVRKERGDEFVHNQEMAAPTVLKIDTEGTEMDVLKGLDQTLARSECRLVYCEIHEDRLEFQGHSVSDIYEFLESHDFSVDDRSIEGYQPFVRGKKA
jgi:FkbM family methyltransferase